MDVNPQVFQHMARLPQHESICAEILLTFRQMTGVIGAFVSGSAARGGMDRFSDIDLGFICENREAREKIWRQRFNWKLPPWFHRMDADHIKSHFIIYLFHPDIHVDLAFYTREDLPQQAGGPYVLAWDRKSLLGGWTRHVNEPYKTPPDWSNVVHEEERVWTWCHNAWMRLGRGEYYDCAQFFDAIRAIVEKWYARLSGSEVFNPRRIEQRAEGEFLDSMGPLFPAPNRESLKKALLTLIQIHNRQREQVNHLIQPEWKTTPAGREKITLLIESIETGERSKAVFEPVPEL